jgi:hypothetical protein
MAKPGRKNFINPTVTFLGGPARAIKGGGRGIAKKLKLKPEQVKAAGKTVGAGTVTGAAHAGSALAVLELLEGNPLVMLHEFGPEAAAVASGLAAAAAPLIEDSTSEEAVKLPTVNDAMERYHPGLLRPPARVLKRKHQHGGVK